MKRVTLLGATGSIGLRTLDLVSSFPEEFQVTGLAARGSNVELIADLCRKYSPLAVALLDGGALDRLTRILPAPRPELLRGSDGLVTLTRDVDADVVVSALVGGAGLLPTMAAVLAGRTVALANKETLVMAGSLMTAAARARGVKLLPVDSEHSAVFQCLAGHRRADVHPQSIVHSMVEYVDGSVIAQLGVADMGVPILYALSYPERRPTPAARLDLTRVGPLTFYEPDTDKFPCLGLARRALEHGGVAPVVLNAANEVAVAAFLERRIGFTEIAQLIEWALDDAGAGSAGSLEACVVLDAETRGRVQRRIDARDGGRRA